MSTTKQGDYLEKKVYALLSQEISAERFLFRSEFCKIFMKKGYYSKDRNNNIIFDVSIEATLPGETQYSLLILIECKNYGRPVPVNDAEEFFSKIDQVGAARVKGIIASTNSFQEGTIRYSQSKGIGLLRYFSDETLKWELPRSPSALVTSQYANVEWAEAIRGLSLESYKPKYFDIYAYSSGEYTTSLQQFMLNLISYESTENEDFDFSVIINPIGENTQLVPYRDDVYIETRAQQVLESIDYASGAVDLDLICKLYEKKMGLRFEFAESDSELVLGRVRFNPLEIFIYSDNHSSLHRQRFTIAHELGHIAMSHSDFMYGEYCEATDTNLDQPYDLGIKDIMRMELQANIFASCLLLPKKRFVSDFMRIAKDLNIRDRGFGLIYLDSQHVNYETFLRVSSRLRNEYRVSRSAIKLRLKKLGYLTEAK